VKGVIAKMVFASVLLAASCGHRGAAPNGSSTPPGPTSAAPDVPSAEDSQSRLGQEVTLTGTARNAKAGAVVVLGGGEPVYLEGVAAWPPDLDGRHVSASGTLRQKKLIPDPVGPNGEIRQGAEGQQLVLESPRWRALP